MLKFHGKDYVPLQWGIFFRLLIPQLALYTLFRLGFFAFFLPTSEAAPLNQYLKAFTIGLRFDLRLAILVAAPVILLYPLTQLFGNQTTSRRATAKKAARRLLIFVTLLVIFGIFQIYAFDFGHFAYLRSRISPTILENLANPDVSKDMVLQTYNVVAILLGQAALLWVSWRVLSTWAFRPEPEPPPDLTGHRKRTARWVTHGGLYLGVLLGVHGSISQFPLRWSHAFFSTNPFVSSLALNPVTYFMDTLLSRDTVYSDARLQTARPALQKHFGQDPLEVRYVNPTIPSSAPGHLRLSQNVNVVYIVMESYAAFKMGYFGNPAGASPVMDNLANSSWIFTRFFTPTEGTARSMFCSVTGLTDISAESTSSRNPRVVNQNSLINSFTGHAKYYFIGGSAAWGNIRGVFQNNIKNLKVFEEEDLERPRTDVWGVNDYDLFDSAAETLMRDLDRTGRPIYAVIQSASYHRPYTIPKSVLDSGEFQIKELSKDELTKYGFSSNEEYNSFRFADHSLGHFFQKIKSHPLYKNTVFVIHGDHGLPDLGADHLSRGYKHFGLSRFHVPLIFHGPVLGAPQVFTTPMSQMDVLPTLVGLFGRREAYRGFGENVFTPPTEARKKLVFSYVYYDRPVTKLVYDERFIVSTGKDGAPSGLFDYTSDTPEKDLRPEDPERFSSMAGLVDGFFEGSGYLLHNNQHLPTLLVNPTTPLKKAK
jgi:hypothetical protein